MTFEQHLDLVAVLARLARSEDRPNGERVRRLVYLLKRKGLVAAQECFYEYRENGPVSFEVLDAVADARSWGVLVGRGYEPGPQAAEFAARLDHEAQAVIDEVVLACRDVHLDALEMAVSCDFLRRADGLGEDAALALVLARTPALSKCEKPARDLLQALALD